MTAQKSYTALLLVAFFTLGYVLGAKQGEQTLSPFWWIIGFAGWTGGIASQVAVALVQRVLGFVNVK